MQQIIQSLSNGDTILETVPAPASQAGKLLIHTSCSLISAGTERMLVDFGRASILEKARQQPEKVRMVIDKVKTDGLLTTIDAVRFKLGQPIPLGYCNVGVITELGVGVSGFKSGERVVSNGSHAEVVRVPTNLCARIPENVDDESAAFTVVAAIGLQGIRLIQPTLGESMVVIGCGLIGLLTVQLLLAQGCRVLAIDFDAAKLQLAQAFGAQICNLASGEDAHAAGMAFSAGRGVDGVIITASTSSSDPVTQAARMSRKRGRIVLVGVTGLELNRADFYEKELSFQVSCSYGPGRYDPEYEEKGHDYPLGFVRWTEQRNFEAILEMMASGRLNVQPLISHRVAFEEAPAAYQLLEQDKSALGILLKYKAFSEESLLRTVALAPANKSSVVFDAEKPICGFIGAGNYASRILIPAFKAAGAQLKTIVTSAGLNSVLHGKPAGFTLASTDMQALLEDAEMNTVAIVTRHNTHANFVSKALRAGKHVFVEKPLALTFDELAEVEKTWREVAQEAKPRHLMVGFNRRFAPQIVKIKELLATIREPKSFMMTINAGAIPAEHWTQDKGIGGGRIIGEACHFIDLMRFLANAPIVAVQACRMGEAAGVAIVEDKAAITLRFADGSFGTIHYLANGAASFPKERIEVFAAGRILQLDNFRKLKAFGWKGFSKMNLWRQDKGQDRCVAAFLSAIANGGEMPITAEETFEVARVTLEVAQQLHQQ